MFKRLFDLVLRRDPPTCSLCGNTFSTHEMIDVSDEDAKVTRYACVACWSSPPDTIDPNATALTS